MRSASVKVLGVTKIRSTLEKGRNIGDKCGVGDGYPVEEEVHEFASGQLVGLGVFLGVRYTDNVLMDVALGLEYGTESTLPQEVSPPVSVYQYVVFPTFFLRSFGRRGMDLLESNWVIENGI